MRDNALDRLDGRSVDFLVITALPVERDALLRIVASPAKLQPNGCPTHYFFTIPAYGRDGSYHVAVTMLNQMGNVEAARHAAQAITDLSPAYVFMVGIAGGVSGRVRLGDVVVATEILYYEVAKQYPEGPQRRHRVYPVDPLLLDRTKNYSETTWQELVSVERPDGESTETPRVTFGPIAAGEKVVADLVFVSDLIKSIPKLVGIEMESYGVATAAAHDAERPRFLTIRGISDLADSSKSDDWQEYAAECAAAFTVGFLRSGPVKLSVTQAVSLAGDADKPRTIIAVRHQSMEPIPVSAIHTSIDAEFGDVDIEELVVNQTDLYVNGRLVDPTEAVRRQEELAKRVGELQLSYPGAELAYCAIAHVPLLFHAGYQLSNKSNVHLLEHDRQTAHWHRMQGMDRGPKLALEEVLPAANSAPGEVILRVSVSYEVTLENIQGLVPSAVASIHLRVPEPQIDLVTSEYQTREYSVRFRRILDQIHSRFTGVNGIHIFYAGPAALAFNFGRQISKTIHPRIVVYNYFSKDVPKYSWGLDITSDSELEESVVRPKGVEGS